MSGIGISCICLTYGRHWLLAEAVESFRRQRYNGPSELIIVNDMPGQTIAINDGSGLSIRVLNLPARLSSLNDKFDLGVAAATYPLVCMWDDDDISLPYRLQISADGMEATGADYLAIGWHYAHNSGQAMEMVNRGIHGGDCFKRETYFALDGSSGDGHNDQNFVGRVRRDARTKYRMIENLESACYIYRWIGVVAHNSGYAKDLATCMAGVHRDIVADSRHRLGVVDVTPRYSEPFEDQAAQCLKTKKENR